MSYVDNSQIQVAVDTTERAVQILANTGAQSDRRHPSSTLEGLRRARRVLEKAVKLVKGLEQELTDLMKTE